MADTESLLERAPRAVRSRVWAQLEAWRWGWDPAHPHMVFQRFPGWMAGGSPKPWPQLLQRFTLSLSDEFTKLPLCSLSLRSYLHSFTCEESGREARLVF